MYCELLSKSTASTFTNCCCCGGTVSTFRPVLLRLEWDFFLIISEFSIFQNYLGIFVFKKKLSRNFRFFFFKIFSEFSFFFFNFVSEFSIFQNYLGIFDFSKLSRNFRFLKKIILEFSFFKKNYLGIFVF
jgi:hypothetical protein